MRNIKVKPKGKNGSLESAQWVETVQWNGKREDFKDIKKWAETVKKSKAGDFTEYNIFLEPIKGETNNFNLFFEIKSSYRLLSFTPLGEIFSGEVKPGEWICKNPTEGSGWMIQDGGIFKMSEMGMKEKFKFLRSAENRFFKENKMALYERIDEPPEDFVVPGFQWDGTIASVSGAQELSKEYKFVFDPIEGTENLFNLKLMHSDSFDKPYPDSLLNPKNNDNNEAVEIGQWLLIYRNDFINVVDSVPLESDHISYEFLESDNWDKGLAKLADSENK